MICAGHLFRDEKVIPSKGNCRDFFASEVRSANFLGLKKNGARHVTNVKKFDSFYWKLSRLNVTCFSLTIPLLFYRARSDAEMSNVVGYM